MRHLASHYSHTSQQGFRPFYIVFHRTTLNEDSWTFVTPLLPSKLVVQTLLCFVVTLVAPRTALSFTLRKLNWLSLTSSTSMPSCIPQTMRDSEMVNPC